MGFLKGIGAYALWIGLMVGLFLIAMLLFSGVAYVSEIVIPWLFDIAWIALGISLLILLPLSFFRGTRVFACWGYMISSFAFGLCGWVYGFLVTYSLWGAFGVIVGLFIAGVGVVPVGMLAAAFHGSWEVVLELAVLVVLTFGSRAYAMYVAKKADEDAYERNMITIEPG